MGAILWKYGPHLGQSTPAEEMASLKCVADALEGVSSVLVVPEVPVGALVLVVYQHTPAGRLKETGQLVLEGGDIADRDAIARTH